MNFIKHLETCWAVRKESERQDDIAPLSRYYNLSRKENVFVHPKLRRECEIIGEKYGGIAMIFQKLDSGEW